MHIRLSDLIVEAVNNYDHLKDLRKLIPPSSATYAERITMLQQLGNELRRITDNSICAKLAIQKIALWRDQHKLSTDSDPEDPTIPAKIATTQNTVFIIDQLKHPDEAIALRKIYGSIFYQLGVLANNEAKIKNLKDVHIDTKTATELIEIDRKESFRHGQQLEKTLTHSDYYIANHTNNIQRVKNSVDRIFRLIHGNGINTPTADEIGMYAAYSSSLQSACLSRQVGAAICDSSGNVLATGKNDVPKFGGGLYSANDGENDNRCANVGQKCHNTDNINKLIDEIRGIINKPNKLNDEEITKIIEELKETRIGSIIEYSRAIHAEMDAITTLARNTNGSSKDTVIYTTTFPCHNCARHIVAAGISKIIYIEPYEKSMALDLHSDSICRDGTSRDKLSVEPFEGASPRRYQSFFLARGDRKDKNTGYMIATSQTPPNSVERVFVASYTDLELKLTESLAALFGKPSGQ